MEKTGFHTSQTFIFLPQKLWGKTTLPQSFLHTHTHASPSVDLPLPQRPPRLLFIISREKPKFISGITKRLPSLPRINPSTHAKARAPLQMEFDSLPGNGLRFDVSCYVARVYTSTTALLHSQSRVYGFPLSFPLCLASPFAAFVACPQGPIGWSLKGRCGWMMQTLVCLLNEGFWNRFGISLWKIRFLLRLSGFIMAVERAYV